MKCKRIMAAVKAIADKHKLKPNALHHLPPIEDAYVGWLIGGTMYAVTESGIYLSLAEDLHKVYKVVPSQDQCEWVIV